MITTQKQDEYWYLSFVEREGPDPRWLGATIVKANSALEAIRVSRRLGCNPGGEVLMHGLPDGKEVPDGILNRLVTSESEMQTLFGGEIAHIKPEQLPPCMGCETEAQS